MLNFWHSRQDSLFDVFNDFGSFDIPTIFSLFWHFLRTCTFLRLLTWLFLKHYNMLDTFIFVTNLTVSYFIIDMSDIYIPWIFDAFDIFQISGSFRTWHFWHLICIVYFNILTYQNVKILVYYILIFWVFSTFLTIPLLIFARALTFWTPSTFLIFSEFMTFLTFWIPQFYIDIFNNLDNSDICNIFDSLDVSTFS